MQSRVCLSVVSGWNCRSNRTLVLDSDAGAGAANCDLVIERRVSDLHHSLHGFVKLIGNFPNLLHSIHMNQEQLATISTTSSL